MILAFAGELRNWPDSRHLALEAGFVATTEKKRRRHGTKKSIVLKMVLFQIERDTVFPLNMTSLISKPIPSKKVQTSIGVYSLTCPMCPSVSSFMYSSKTLPGAFFLKINSRYPFKDARFGVDKSKVPPGLRTLITSPSVSIGFILRCSNISR